MAQYNCTLMGCVSAQTATYPDLQSCQASCVGWGCPPQLTQDTDIYFVYDSSNSYNNPSREGMFLAATAWTQTLVNDGWVGTARHSMAGWGQAVGSNIQNVMINGVLEPISHAFPQGGEDWLAWGLFPYLLTPTPDYGSNPLNTSGYISSVSPADQLANFFRWSPRANVDITGATIPTNPQLVISFCHGTSNYGVGDYYTSPPVNATGTSPTGFKSHYNMWSKLYDTAPSGIMNAFLFPVKTDCASEEYYAWGALMLTVTQGIATILKGNQDNISIGGTGTLDGTFVSYPTGAVMANGAVCNPSGAMGQNNIWDPNTSSYTTFLPWCTTAPNGPATANPCSPISYASGLTMNCSPYYIEDCPDANGNYICTTGTTLFPGPEQICYWDSMAPAYGPYLPYNGMTNQTPWQEGGKLCGAAINLNWIAGQPTWGALEDKGWGINTDLVGANTDFAATLSTSVGVVSVASTICISAETDYNVNPDFSASTLIACNDVCFPSLLPWYCDNGGVNPCYQSALGSYIWPSNAYPTSLSAETDCNANCSMVTAYTCSELGCIVDNNNGQFNSIGECVTACTSYSCTTEGCLGPYQGTGATGTYVEFSSCTATCYHYECVTDNYANSVLPNIYNTGITATDGCVQLSGSVGTSPNLLGFNEYTTFSACTGSCISWGCCDPLGITDNSVMYVYYDITSMNAAQCQNAIKGIIDWTESNLEFTGRVEHLMIWSERWLQYPTIPYTMSFGRFEDYNNSSYPDANGDIVYVSGADFGTTFYGHSAGYWTGVNAPASTLGSLYSSGISQGLFESWIDPLQYSGNATHNIHDSFEPGDNLGNWYNSSNGKYTKGYGGMASASTTDDVINVVFQDESYSMYHGNNATPNFTGGIGPQPTIYYKFDYLTYKFWHGNVTATTVGNSEGGTSRSLLYPTTSSSGQLNASKNFALHAVAAISSGDLSPQNGIWSATTYPLNNANSGLPTPYTHAECLYNLPLLKTENPYWSISGASIIGELTGTSNSNINGGVTYLGQYIYFTQTTNSGQGALTIASPGPVNQYHEYSAMTQVGTGATYGSPSGITVNGNYAYIADGLSGLTIMNISTPANPTIVGNFSGAGYQAGTTGGAHDVVLSGNSIFMADGISGLTIINVTNPASPTITGNYNPNCYYDGLTGSTCGGQTGHTIDGEFTQKVILSGDGTTSYAYLANGNKGIQVINVTNPAAPSWAGSANTSGAAVSIDVDENYIYAAVQSSAQALEIFYVDNVSNISIVANYAGNYQAGAMAYDLVKDDWRLVVAFSDGFVYGGARVFDVSEPTNPLLLPIDYSNGLLPACHSTALAVSGNTAFVSVNNSICSTNQLIYMADVSSPFVPEWGGLDKYSWDINPRFETYNQQVFENDLNGFLQAYTISCSTPCHSASTAPTGAFPYSSETECNPQCVEYNCGDMGCYTAMTGEYNSLSACTAQCESYSCSLTGCGIYNQPTGTTFPITQADGIDYYSYYGSGGTFSSNTDCELVCGSWNCGPTGCIPVVGTGGTYSSQTHCELSPCSGYTCTEILGCIPFIGDGSQLTTPSYVTEYDCLTGCTFWLCDINLGCIEETGATTGSIYEFATEQICDIYCASFNCGDNGCTQFPNLSGTFQDITNLPVVSSAACTASCFSYNCTSTGCTEQAGSGGTYDTNQNCLIDCQSYTCTTEGCEVYNAPNYGTGGTFTTNLSCETQCLHWKCVPSGCQSFQGTGVTNSYSSLTQCLDVAFDPITGVCTTYDCTDTGCVALTGTSGQFDYMSACTADCTSYVCSGGTFSPKAEGQAQNPPYYGWTNGGCKEYNLSGSSWWTGTGNLGTGGTFQHLWQCNDECKSWDCSFSGCNEVSLGAGSGGTFSTPINCETACTSYNCTNIGCFSQVGSGGTWFNATNAPDGYTACTGVCISYNCADLGCLPAYVGSGGTYFSANTAVNPPTSMASSALTACTTACTSYGCYTGGCATFNSPYSTPPGIGYGTGGTYSAMSACTGVCIHWGCINTPSTTISVGTDIYAYYDTTSMGQSAVEDAITGLELWVSGLQNFTGNTYHTMVNDERWLCWATSVYVGAFTSGTSTIIQNPIAMGVHSWANTQIPPMTNVYDNMVAGQTSSSYPGVTTKGNPPAAAYTDDILVITFIDESGPNSTFGPLVYSNVNTPNPNEIPQFAATNATYPSQVTPTWVADYSAYSATYATVSAGVGSLNCFMYPTQPTVWPLSVHQMIFALQVVASIDSGNKTPGLQGENWQSGTAPRRVTSGGIQGGIPELCSIADLTALEISNPYLVDPIGNVGLLDQKGWGYNILFDAYTQADFNNDLTTFLTSSVSGVSSNLTECLSAATSPTTIYPFPSLSACTGDCFSWECTATGCVQFNGTGTTPTYYSLESDCISACTSVNCTNSGCTDQLGTGGTFTNTTNCLTACTSFNCEDITSYTPSASWPIAPGCIEQLGSGGTFFQNAIGVSGSSILSYTACTAQCQSWECNIDCVAQTTGCTAWPNTGATYSSDSACTGSCVINWYCTEEFVNSTCDSQIILGQPGGVINNGFSPDSPATISTGYGALGWFADNAQTSNWSNYSFSLGVGQTLNYTNSLTNSCPGPWIAQNLSSTNLPGYLHTLQDITFNPNGNFSLAVTWPRIYTNWSSLINDFISLGVPVNLTMNAATAMSIITGNNTGIPGTNGGWTSLSVDYGITPCICYTVECDVFCDDGNIAIPSTALGPYATSGIAETNCCTQVTWSCITETIIDSCSGKTTLPGQYASNTNAWDWLTVNLPNANLNTLNYESTTPAINISGACEGPNGGALYDVAPVSYTLLNPSVSYNVWNLFINQAQAHGATGLLSGMSYSNVNQYLYLQSGQTIQVCEEICHCSTTPCRCIELYDGTGDYLTHDDCISGTTLLPACCPNTGTTGTSWNCTSGITWNPICEDKPYLGHFNDKFAFVDNFRTIDPYGTFGVKKFIKSHYIAANGTSVPVTPWNWNDVWTNLSATSIANGIEWQSCFKEIDIILSTQSFYLPYEYIQTISHPAVSGGLGYTTWNSFYTAASSAFPTLTTSQTAMQVCQEIDSVYWGSNQFGCEVDTMNCCNRGDCYCYELYVTGGTYSTEAPCLSACCPTYTGWTCEHLNAPGTPSTFYTPCYFVSQSSPILLTPTFYDTVANGFDGETECNQWEFCDPTPRGDFWSCVTTDVSTCNPNGNSLGEITGTTSGPAIALNGVQYPFSSSTDQLFPLLPTGLGYLGGYGQVETILTDSNYYSPFLPLSATTFQLGSLDSLGQNVVNPNGTGVINPLPYTLPTETCMGTNFSGGTGMPMFNIMSVSHNYINANTPYYTWDAFITAAIGVGYGALTNTMSVADVGTLYPVLFGCSETMLNGLQPPSSYPAFSFSGCNWHFEMQPCLCDTTCCCETGFTHGFNTEQECLDPLSGCCPELSSYTCTINGCIDPGNGSGTYTGVTALQDCESVCQEWVCFSSTSIYDSCIDKVEIPTGGGVLPDINEFAPGYLGPFPSGPWDAMDYFADTTNGLQGQLFSNYKWECLGGCGWSTQDCDGPNGAWKYLKDINIFTQGAAGNTYNLLGAPYTDWVSLINGLNTNLGVTSFNLTMTHNDVAQLLYGGILTGPAAPEKYMMAPGVGNCKCIPSDCECLLTGGTGHTNGYNLNNQQGCEYVCCSGITIPECSILITGQEEGVLYYDFDTNTTTKLFDEPGFEKLDIAARQDKLWIYKEIAGTDIIREYDVIWAPFQKVFNRDITCPAGLGRGLTATEDPNILLSATDKVYKLDITVSPATSVAQFTLPSGMTCTGDIVYDSTNGGMIITYGTGTTQYVGKFTSTGTLLEESHINLTTAGIGVNEQIDSLFNYGTWTTSAGGGYTYFDVPYNGPIYGITTDRRVIELLTNPLQFAPVATQTLTLVNQITNKVHGASNILNIVNGQMHDCADIDITMIDDDLWWCDELLGCLVYPYNITPPNSFGPHLTMVDCLANCNFVCGDCAGSCECTLITTPLSSGCNIEPTMAACIIQNQSNTNILNGGEGCCDCFGCGSVTYYGWNSTQNQWAQYTVTSNVTFGNFAQVWNSSGTYVSGDVVRYTGPNGDECCYTYVNPLVPNSGNDPYQSWIYYQDNYQNNIPQDVNKIYWIPCDEDCPTVITWSCDTGTTLPCPPTDLTSPWYTYQGSTTFCNSDWCTPTATHVDCQCCDGYSQNNTCGAAQDTQAGGLSFTPQIQAIAMGGYTLWNTPFQNLKWDCGSQQFPLPSNPCVALIGHWAKILGCRITHIGGQTVNPIQGALKNTWADFIDLLNSVLVSGGIYNFPYSDRWQDLEAILGSQSYDGSHVPGNQVDIECIWEYCECSTLSGPPIPINDSCVNKVDITPNIPLAIPFDVEIDYFTTIGNPQQSGLADPNSGAMFSDSKYERPNWAGSQSPCFGPLGGIFRFRHSVGITGCRTRHSVQANAILHGGDTNYGQFVDFWNGQGMQGTSYNLNYNDNWSINRQKVEDWCGTGTDKDNGNNSLLGSTSHCQCTYPPNPSYDPCNCVPIYGPGGYPTSAACEEVCCSGETSWSCNTGTTVIWQNSSDCHGRYVDLPGIFTDDNPMSNNSPLGYIANPSNGLQNTLLSSIKFTTSGCTGCAPPSYSFSNPNSTPPCRDSNFDNNMSWAYMTKIFAHSIGVGGVPIIETTNTWYDFINEANASPFCSNCVNLSMTVQQVAQILSSLNNAPAFTMEYEDTWCYCPSTPCECVEISGNTGYPTSASCEVICCSGMSMDLWECTGILGCFQTSNGTYASQTLCEDDCKEWECHPAGPCYGNCDTVGIGAPRLALPSTVWGNLTNIMPYFADPLTPPLQHPNLPTIVGNMQNTSIHYYKFDCSTCSLQQTCLSPHGSWFGPASIYVKSLPGQVPVMNYIGSVDTWVGVIDGLNLIGTFGTFNYNTPYTTVTGVLAQNGAEIVVMGESCFGTNGPCDCVLIDGTGHTGTWSLTDYTSCYSSCCQTTDTYDCTIAGCILNTNGTGDFGSYIGCTADCKEWMCVEGNMTQNTCSGNTYLNVDWLTTTYSSSLIGGGVVVQSMRVLDYISNPIHGLQFQNVSDYSYINEQGVVASGPNDCTRSGTFSNSALTNQYPVYSPSYIYTVNNSLNPNNPAFPNATNYNSATNTCSNPGCMFNTWADFITGCNMVGVMYNSLPMSLNSTYTEARNAITAHFGLMQKVVLSLSVKKCYCEGTACNCPEIPGTGHTGNYYSNQSDCLVAANSNPCCTPPDEYWHCQPYTTSPQGGCICKQQPGPGGYPTLADCKADSSNCCDDHTYDCMNQGTPLQGCYGVVAPNVGPYQTMQQCDDECEKVGYNCKGVDTGPGGSAYVACVPCVGNFCQYTTATAAGAPFYGDPLLQCQSNCPGEGCWKCCMTKFGAIYQLSPSLSALQCFCKKGDIEVQCDGDGPCPYPVSCMPGFVYDWTQCKCVCEMSQECPNGWTWSFKECKCIQNDDGPVDFVGPQGKVLQSISDFIHKPVYSIVEEFLNGVELLDYYTKKGWKLDVCTYCTDGTEGICVLNGCLYFIDYEKYGTEQVGWKSLLLGNGIAIESPTVPAIDGPTHTMPDGTIMPGATHGDTPTTEGYSCRVDQNKAPSYTICIHTGSPDYISYFGNMPPLYATLQDCYNDGCESVETPLGSWAPNTDLLLADEPKENKHSCCPVYNRPGYGPTWISMNLCGTNHIMTGAPVLGVGCGADPTASSGGNDPYWCCEWTIITGSDIELKENIEKVGESESGINIYEFEYKDKSFGEGTFRGVIAQEVPQASTIQEDGYLYVNYSQIDVDFKKVR